MHHSQAGKKGNLYLKRKIQESRKVSKIGGQIIPQGHPLTPGGLEARRQMCGVGSQSRDPRRQARSQAILSSKRVTRGQRKDCQSYQSWMEEEAGERTGREFSLTSQHSEQDLKPCFISRQVKLWEDEDSKRFPISPIPQNAKIFRIQPKENQISHKLPSTIKKGQITKSYKTQMYQICAGGSRGKQQGIQRMGTEAPLYQWHALENMASHVKKQAKHTQFIESTVRP